MIGYNKTIIEMQMETYYKYNEKQKFIVKNI